VRSRAGTD